MGKKRVLFLIFAAMLLFIVPSTARAAEYTVYNEQTAEIALYVGETGTLVPENLTEETGAVTFRFYAYDDDVVEVDENGQFTALAVGYAEAAVYGYDADGWMVFWAECSFTVTYDMSSVTLGTKKIKKYLPTYYSGCSVTVKIKSDYAFNADNSTSSITFSNTEMSGAVSFSAENELTFTFYSTGKSDAVLTLNGKEYPLTVNIVSIYMSKASRVAAKKSSFTLKVKGTKTAAKWKSSDKSVAKVSSNGVVQCKKKGNAVITATIEGERVGCAVSVVSSGMVKVIKCAEKIGSTCVYSQEKRMQSGYYDCSSLVWKAYSKMGVTFGSATYAPVAADDAKWCKANGKTVSKSMSWNQIQNMKFMPGDLLFQTGADNGRYKGIYHVEMFTGYEVAYYTEDGTPVVETLWAARAPGYGYGTLIMRPTS